MPLHFSSIRAGVPTALSAVRCPQLWFPAAHEMFHQSKQRSMLEATRPLWRSLTATLAKLQMSLDHTATLKKAMQRLISTTQGKYYCMALRFCCSGSFPAKAQQHLSRLQAHLMSRLALTSAGWLHTCSGSGTTRLTPTWAASS